MSYHISEATGNEYSVFKKGQQGWQQIVGQLCLNTHYPAPGPLVLDGYFGPESDRVAKEVQSALGVAPDGSVGPETQRAYVIAKCKHAEKGVTPAGLLSGINDMESSYYWAVVSPLNDNGTRDVGSTQVSLNWPADEPHLLGAFNIDASQHVLAGEVLGFYKYAINHVPNQRAWEISALYHNWPVASYAIAEGRESYLNKPFAFTTAKGYPTGLAYANHYIDVSSAPVTSWTPAP